MEGDIVSSTTVCKDYKSSKCRQGIAAATEASAPSELVCNRLLLKDSVGWQLLMMDDACKVSSGA